jgi:hypothetical protein
MRGVILGLILLLVFGIILVTMASRGRCPCQRNEISSGNTESFLNCKSYCRDIGCNRFGECNTPECIECDCAQKCL